MTSTRGESPTLPRDSKGGIDHRNISSYNRCMRRKKGHLLPIEVAILDAGIDLQSRREPEFYGFLIAKEMAERAGSFNLAAYGTLYKALSRMEKQDLLTSRWEDYTVAEVERRPRRRLYEVTAKGEKALISAREREIEADAIRQKGLAPA